jgi:hypothetical protein
MGIKINFNSKNGLGWAKPGFESPTHLKPILILKGLYTVRPIFTYENDAILEIKRRVSTSNITKIESAKSYAKQITLTIKSMFVGDKNAIINDTKV